MKMSAVALVAITLAGATPALADPVTNLNTPLPVGTGWGTLPGENTGTAAITTTAARSGNGSLELTGDRTRAQTGIQYAPFTTNLMNLDDVRALTFDWQVAGDSQNLSYTPALRLLVQDGAQRSELIWEGAYQASPLGTNGSAATNPAGTWYSSAQNDLFWQNIAGSGPTYQPGTFTYVLMTLSDWAAYYAGNTATVSGISVGAGSGAGANYHAFVDNVSLFNTTNRAPIASYNFEVAAAAVPEPASWAMMLAGFGAIGVGLRKRTKTKTSVSFA